MRRLLVLLALTTACRGPEGPIGPEGPPGTINRLVVSATADSVGTAIVALPAAINNPVELPPNISCYIAVSATYGAWLAVAGSTSVSTPYCGVAKSGSTWLVSTHRAPPGWVALWVVTW